MKGTFGVCYADSFCVEGGIKTGTDPISLAGMPPSSRRNAVPCGEPEKQGCTGEAWL